METNKNLTFSWKNVNVVLKKENKTLLTLSNGQGTFGSILTLMGPSGCGKSTLLNVLGGIKDSNLIIKGEIFVNNVRVKTNEELIKIVQYKSQFSPYFSELTIYESLRMHCLLHYNSELEAHQNIMYYLDALNISHENDKVIGEVSSGTRERLNIIMTFLSSSEILILDEPFSKLDSYTCNIVLELMKKSSEAGKLIIITLHQPTPEVLTYLDYVYILSEFGTIYFGRFEDILTYFRKLDVFLSDEDYESEIMDLITTKSLGDGENDFEDINKEKILKLSKIYHSNDKIELPGLDKVFFQKKRSYSIFNLVLFSMINFIRSISKTKYFYTYVFFIIVYSLIANISKISYIFSCSIFDRVTNFLFSKLTFFYLSKLNFILEKLYGIDELEKGRNFFFISNFYKLNILLLDKLYLSILFGLFLIGSIIPIKIFKNSIVENKPFIKNMVLFYHRGDIIKFRLILLFIILSIPLKLFVGIVCENSILSSFVYKTTTPLYLILCNVLITNFICIPFVLLSTNLNFKIYGYLNYGHSCPPNSFLNLFRFLIFSFIITIWGFYFYEIYEEVYYVSYKEGIVKFLLFHLNPLHAILFIICSGSEYLSILYTFTEIKDLYGFYGVLIGTTCAILLDLFLVLKYTETQKIGKSQSL